MIWFEYLVHLKNIIFMKICDMTFDNMNNKCNNIDQMKQPKCPIRKKSKYKRGAFNNQELKEFIKMIVPEDCQIKQPTEKEIMLFSINHNRTLKGTRTKINNILKDFQKEDHEKSGESNSNK